MMLIGKKHLVKSAVILSIIVIIVIIVMTINGCKASEDRNLTEISSDDTSNISETVVQESTTEVISSTEPAPIETTTEMITEPPTEPTTVNPLVLKRGDVNNDVKDLQINLKNIGLYTGDIDSSFGPLTESAVKSLQELYGLNPDGIVQGETWNALNKAVANIAIKTGQ